MSAVQELATAVSNLTDVMHIQIDLLNKVLFYVGEDSAISKSVQKLNDLTLSVKDSSPETPQTPA